MKGRVPRFVRRLRLAPVSDGVAVPRRLRRAACFLTFAKANLSLPLPAVLPRSLLRAWRCLDLGTWCDFSCKFPSVDSGAPCWNVVLHDVQASLNRQYLELRKFRHSSWRSWLRRSQKHVTKWLHTNGVGSPQLNWDDASMHSALFDTWKPFLLGTGPSFHAFAREYSREIDEAQLPISLPPVTVMDLRRQLDLRPVGVSGGPDGWTILESRRLPDCILGAVPAVSS